MNAVSWGSTFNMKKKETAAQSFFNNVIRKYKATRNLYSKTCLKLPLKNRQVLNTKELHGWIFQDCA